MFYKQTHTSGVQRDHTSVGRRDDHRHGQPGIKPSMTANSTVTGRLDAVVDRRLRLPRRGRSRRRSASYRGVAVVLPTNQRRRRQQQQEVVDDNNKQTTRRQ